MICVGWHHPLATIHDVCIMCVLQIKNHKHKMGAPTSASSKALQSDLTLAAKWRWKCRWSLDAAIARFPGQLSITSRCQGENVQSRVRNDPIGKSVSNRRNIQISHNLSSRGPVFTFSARQWKCGVLCRKAKGSPKCCDVLAKQHKAANQSAQTSSLCKRNQDDIFK